MNEPSNEAVEIKSSDETNVVALVQPDARELGAQVEAPADPKPPQPMGSHDVLIEAAAPGLLQSIVFLDRQIGAIQEKAKNILEGYANAKGWDLATHDVGLDINSGFITISPKQEAVKPEAITP